MRSVRMLILACASVAAMGAMYMVRSALESRANAPVPTVQVNPALLKPAAVEQPKTIDILVAAKDVNIGRTLSPEDVKWQSWPAESASPYFYVKSEDPEALDTVVGSATRLAMRAGEPVTTEKVIDLQGAGVMASLLRKGMRAVAVPISDVTGAGGFILPGDFVDLLLTRQLEIEEINPETGGIERTLTHSQTDTVMETVRVLAIDQRLGENDNTATAIGNTATIELTPEQAELITLTRQIAKQERGFMTLSLRSFGEMVEEYGEDIDKVMPKTILDLQALAKAKVERARKLRELAAEFKAEQLKTAEAEKLRQIEAERAAREAAAQQAATAQANQPQGVTVNTAPAQDSGIVLVRNGSPIVVRTVTPEPAGETQ